MADLIGQKLGQYEITGKLGSGGMATVYRARQSSVGRDVAIKVIGSRLAENPEFLKRFEREARTIAALSHPYILKLFDFGQQGDMLYLVMELLSGGSLADLISKDLPSLEQVSRLLEQIVSALDYAHEQGIIHRDLKPQNVLLDAKGNAILTDFGIAKVLNETTALTASGISIGTPSYMSPEQWQGQALDARSDIYALGVMLFEMLSGRLPFNGDTPASIMYMHLQAPPLSITSIRFDLPLSVEEVINKALAKDPSQRFQSAGGLASAFKLALAGQTPSGIGMPLLQADTVVVAAPVTIGGVKTPARQDAQSRLLILGAIVVVVLVGMLLIVLSSGGQNTNPTATLTSSTQVVAASTATPLVPTQTTQPTLSPLPPSPTVTETQAVSTTTPEATHTPTRAVPTSTPTEAPNLETLVALTVAAKATQTANVIASYTKTPTMTPTSTPNTEQTMAAMVAATETVNAIASFTKTFTATPIPTNTTTFTPTATWISTPTITPTLTSTPTATPALTFAPGTKRTDAHGIAQVYVPAGCFMMGSTEQQIAEESKQHASSGIKNEGPQHQVCITQGYWLDTYEVTNAAYQQFINAGGYTTPGYWSETGWAWKQANNTTGPFSYNGFTDPQQPRVGVTWYEAEAYAKWRGGRLPTEAEWEYTARGPESRIYPWGNTWNGSRVNTAVNIETKPVGSYESGKSWIGAYDMAGNVWEWVADWYSDSYYQQKVKDDPMGPNNGQERVMRGGSWIDDQFKVRAAYRDKLSPVVYLHLLGFRVVGGVSAQ